MRRALSLPAVILVSLVSGCGSASRPAVSSPTSSATEATTRSAAPAATPAPTLGFEGVPLQESPPLAPASTTGTKPVNGISCGAREQLAYHIHAHLTVFVRGAARSIPGGVGIPGSQVEQSTEGPVAAGGSCIYWLHTHAPDGVIHIESPDARVYTLGDFFDEWHQPLSRSGVAGADGPVRAIVDGRPWPRDPRAIPLRAHAAIQLEVGAPGVAFEPVRWPSTGL